MTMGQIIKREIQKIFLIDPRRIIFIFGAILIYFFLFSFLYQAGVVKGIPTVVLDQDQSSMSRNLVERFEDNESFSIVQYASSEEEMRQAIKEKKAYAAIEIPHDFSKCINLGQGSSLLYMVNGANLIFANTTSSAGQDIVAEFSNQIASGNVAFCIGKTEQQVTSIVAPVYSEIRILGNPTQNYVLFFTIGLAMTAFQQGVFFAVGASVHSDYLHIQEINDTSIQKLLLGKFIVHWILALVAFIIFAVIGINYWNEMIKASLIYIFILANAFIFSIIAFGLLVSTFFFTELRFIRASLVYVVPAFIFSGYTWPIESMSPMTKILAQLFPLSWMSNALRELWLYGTTAHLVVNIIVLVCMGLICLTFLKKCYVRGLEKHRTESIIFR